MISISWFRHLIFPLLLLIAAASIYLFSPWSSPMIGIDRFSPKRAIPGTIGNIKGQDFAELESVRIN